MGARLATCMNRQATDDHACVRFARRERWPLRCTIHSPPPLPGLPACTSICARSFFLEWKAHRLVTQAGVGWGTRIVRNLKNIETEAMCRGRVGGEGITYIYIYIYIKLYKYVYLNGLKKTLPQTRHPSSLRYVMHVRSPTPWATMGCVMGATVGVHAAEMESACCD